MDNNEKLTEAKLMAIENGLQMAFDRGYDKKSYLPYAHAKEILLAIHNAEIAEELRQHEASLLTMDEKPE